MVKPLNNNLKRNTHTSYWDSSDILWCLGEGKPISTHFLCVYVDISGSSYSNKFLCIFFSFILEIMT